MANDIATMFPEMDRNEIIYADFIKSRIQKNGGSLKFQHITGQLSQLQHDVRAAIGATPKELMIFLKKYDRLFTIDDGVVSLKNSPGNRETASLTKDVYRKEISERESAFPKTITDAAGIIIKVQPTFGFIAVKDPVKTSVYFTPSCYRDGNEKLLTDIEGMVPGKKVRLNARIGNVDFESKYRATKVWFSKDNENEVLHPEGFIPKIPKTRETGLYDADTSEGYGTIQKIFDTYGFIVIDGDQNNTVFFHKNRVCNVENVNDLSKIFHPGDLVDYKAVRSKKQHLKVRWEATKVWIRKKSKSKANENNEFVTSDYESMGSQSKNTRSQKATGCSGSDHKRTKDKIGLESKDISNQIGKIYPSTKGIVIKFGEKDSKLADADSCLFYLHKVKVEDVSWEFSDGDTVKFDGVKIKSPPGYKALLAWVGDKPDVVPIPLGDFPEQSDEDVSENESYMSKTSSTSAMSENHLGLSEAKRQNVYSSVSSLVSNASKKSHSRSRSRADEFKRQSNYNKSNSNSHSRSASKKSHSRSRSRADEFKRQSNYNKGNSNSHSRSASKKSHNRSRSRADDLKMHSNYNEYDSHSVSRSSSKKSHNRSRSRVDEFKRRSNYNEDDSHSVSSHSSKKSFNEYGSRINENKRHDNYKEIDSHSVSSDSKSSQYSGLNSGRHRRSKSKNSNLNKNYQTDCRKSSNPQLTIGKSKGSSVESVNSLSSDIKNKLKPNPNLFKSWGDTPYPDDDDEEEESDKIHLKAHGREGIQRKNDKYSNGSGSSGKSSPLSDEMDKQIENASDNLMVEDSVNKTDSNVGCEISNKSDQVPAAFQSRYAEIFLSDEEFSDALEEVNENTVISNDDGSNEIEDSPIQEEDKPMSYIKRFYELDGVVKKVFCRYAEIENDRLKKIVPFFWNDMYHNGVPVTDKFDDLQEVLSPGRTVKFNCFEVVDDAGTYFVKVTVAWKGNKPKITEMTPEEFIKHNDLCFSGKEIPATDLVESSFSESMRPLNAESAATAAPRKFLTVTNMSDDEEIQEEEIQLDIPANSEARQLKEDLDTNFSSQEYADLRENVLSNSENMDIPQLTDAISRMLESSRESQIDSNIVASDLVNMVLSTVGAGRYQSLANSIPSTQAREESVETSQTSRMTDSYAQTIITGKIFSESIFTL